MRREPADSPVAGNERRTAARAAADRAASGGVGRGAATKMCQPARRRRRCARLSSHGEGRTSSRLALTTTCPLAIDRRRQGAESRSGRRDLVCFHRPPSLLEHRDHRARRPREDDARRPHAAAGGDVPREPARRGARHGLEPAREGAGITILSKNLSVRWGDTRSTSWIPRATPISEARSSGSCAWWMACSCWWTRPRGRCRRRGS
jgi:hypothetical protein